MTKKKTQKKTQPAFRAGINPRKRVQIFFDPEENMTKESFASELDINVMLDRFTRTGEMTNVRERQYGDASDEDFIDASMALARAQSDFENLPDEVKAHYGNLQGVFDALNDPEQHSTLVEHGILDAGLLPPADHSALGDQPKAESDEVTSEASTDLSTSDEKNA